jgi:proteasome accessory factor B
MARMLRIHTLLEKGRFPNCQRLAEELEVSPKTIQRDIDFMRYQLELPIDYDSVRHGFFYSGAVHKFPSLTISEGELTALLVAQKAIEQYKGTVFQKPLESAFAKIAAGLPAGVEVSIRALSEVYSFRAAQPAIADLKVFEAISEAVLSSLELTFIYHPMSKSKPGLRRVQPYHLRCMDNQWYLFGFDIAREALRTFALTRMEKVNVTRVHFQKASGFSADQVMEGAFGAFESKETRIVRLTLDAFAARIIRERPVHPTQTLKALADGGAQLTLRVGLAPDLVRWILGFGEHAEVVSPPDLRRQIRVIAEQIASLNT